MKVLDLFGTLHTRRSVQPLLGEQIDVIRHKCSQFIVESKGVPVYKCLDKICTFTKLKARVKKRSDTFSESFNNAFAPKLRQRAIYAHGGLSESLTPSYYIFPINGYKYVFNTQIENSSIYETVYNHIDSDELFAELLQHSYSNTNLVEGIKSGSEILFHNIPCCYAINTQAYEQYDELLSIL